MEESLKLIKQLNICEEYIVLACSYGPDSMALLDLLKKESNNIVVAHVNHKLRIESDEEEVLLKKYCEDNNLIFEVMTINDYPKGNTEMNARILRYNFFESLLNKYHSRYLFTAHHGDDLMETVLMRLTRGASFKGYAGFITKTIKKNYQIIRPLIHMTKDEILTYVNETNIPYAIDKTNKEDKYTRNRIRNHILPELKKENKNCHKKFLKFSELISGYEEFFNKETENIFNKNYQNNKLDLNDYYLLDNIFKKRLLDRVLFEIYGDNINVVSDIHAELIMKLIESDKQNSYVILPKNVKVSKFYNMLEFDYYENMEKSYTYVLKEKVDLELGTIFKLDESDISKSNYLIRLNSEELLLPIIVRTRQNGDRINVKNMNGSKKVNDIFIDNKVSSKERDIYPIVTDSNDNILWIPGLKKSNFDKQLAEKYDIILKYEKGERNEK